MTVPHRAFRWWVAAMATLLMVCLGTVYAWSYFQKPICDAYGWSNSQVSLAFSLAICFLGLAAAWGGARLAVLGPARLSVLGGILFGVGYLAGALALHLRSLPLLYLGYGVIGGTGLGLAYVTPVATVAKWFPDRKGFATGMVIMGFGLGALLMSKVLAPLLMAWAIGGREPLVAVFGVLGLAFLVLTVPMAMAMRNPPAGFCLPHGTPPPAATGAAREMTAAATARECLLSREFVILWLMFFCNIAAGIAIIGFQSPLLQDLLHKAEPTLGNEALAGYGATLIAVSSLFNGLGRFFWGWLSDRIGRRTTFALILGTQLAAFVALLFTGNPWAFMVLVCYVLLCYGGGFGMMPAFVLDVFGTRLMPVIYGAILTAWAAAGIAGPQIVARLKDAFPADSSPGLASRCSFAVGTAFLLVGLLLCFLVKSTPFQPRNQGRANRA
jgi:OFA family oxalate/formate antiporter-like MFS transporter